MSRRGLGYSPPAVDFRSIQRAMHLAAHSSARTHSRYVMSTKAMRQTPNEALSPLPAALDPYRVNVTMSVTGEY